MSVHRPFRCLVGMAVHAEDPANDETDKTLWILARFTFLLAELGILALSVCIGRVLDTYSSDPDPAFLAEQRSGSRVLMIKNLKRIYG
jgi:hypothetical protein